VTLKKRTRTKIEASYCGKLRQMLVNACCVGVRGYCIKQPTIFTAPTTKSVEVKLCPNLSHFTEDPRTQNNKILNIKVIESSLNYAT